jgi:superfamily I DNA and/or RNA helicase
VDKFQGQEAPIVVVSLCRSAGEATTSGRGLEFVLDANRLNVAVSRAWSLAIVVGDPRLVLSPAGSIPAMKRLNLLARLIHQAGTPHAGAPAGDDARS